MSMTPEQEKKLAEAHARATWSQNQILTDGSVDKRLDYLAAQNAALIERIEALETAPKG